MKKKKPQKKQINKLDDNNANDDSQGDQGWTGTFNSLCAVDHKAPVIKTFATELATHPLATNESLMTKLNI